MARSIKNSGRGFAGMDPKKQRAAAAEGGRNSGGNFKNDPQRASREGMRGAAAQPLDAKRRGGENSHRNS